MQRNITVLVVGWYGTETIGDRAILAGIIELYARNYNKINLIIGSLNPKFTERTIFEDTSFYNSYVLKGTDLHSKIINAKNWRILRRSVISADDVIMGGGPLMTIDELQIILSAFRLGKRHNRRNILFGVGLGPLRNQKLVAKVAKIINLSHWIFWRDEISMVNARENFNRTCNHFVIPDPAVFPCLAYKKSIKVSESKGPRLASMNFRKPPLNYVSEGLNPVEKFIEIIDYFAAHFDKVVLMPMHYYFFGDDDRVFLNELKFKALSENVVVCNEPLTLESTLEMVSASEITIGMRYHSVIFQSILADNNIIVDYTDKISGKIVGFLTSFTSIKLDSPNYRHIEDIMGDQNQIDWSLDRFENFEVTNTNNGIKELLSLL